MSIDNFLYEIIEDYKDAETDDKRAEIFNDFCSSIWNNKNKRRTHIKTIKFKIRDDLLDTEIGRIFNEWTEINFKSYKAKSQETDWCSLIRQKINNIYTRYFDNQVILNIDYISSLYVPKRLYFKWIDGVEMTPKELIDEINDAACESVRLYETYRKQKMKITWAKYKKLIEGFLKRAFDNCELIEDYEKKVGFVSMHALSREDNFYIKYICKSLEGEMLKWQKEYYKVRDHKKYARCVECGKMIEKTNNKKKYCDDCAIIFKKKSNAIADKKYKEKKRENRKLSEFH